MHFQKFAWIVTPLKLVEINLSENNLNWILLAKISW